MLEVNISLIGSALRRDLEFDSSYLQRRRSEGRFIMERSGGMISVFLFL